MTFIASVIAKQGVAVVADSFRTTIEQSITEDSFLAFLKKKKGGTPKKLDLKELINLFEEKASHTRNYVDKLLKFDDYSAISSTGAAYINGKEIKDIIQSISASMQADKGAYDALTIEQKLDAIQTGLKADVLRHLDKYSMNETDFIFSHYNKTKNEPQVFVIKIKRRDKQDLTDDTKNPLIAREDKTHLKIITDGQDTFVDRLIFGSLYTNMHNVKSGVYDYIVKKFKPKKTKKSEVLSEVFNFDFLKEVVGRDVFAIKFRELSLQEAVDLAALLIKIVMDIQVYTEKIPTVGGLIRLATISKEKGFCWVSGDRIEAPKII